MVIGMAAAAAPVVVHWLTRPRPMRAPLSTIRFVREAVRQRRARHRLRDFLILAARTLAILLLAAAFAGPRWNRPPLVSDDQTGSTVRVVVLDVSQSMAAVDRGMQALDRARPVTAGYLKYRRDLKANLILAAARPEAVFDTASSNLESLREELARCRVLPERLDVNRALTAAAEMLTPTDEDDRRRRELVVISDFQRENWGGARFDPLPADTQIQLESTAAMPPPANLAITRAVCRPLGLQQDRVQLEIDVGNYSTSARKATLEVALGESVFRLDTTCSPGQKTSLTEEVPVRTTGWLWGEVRLVGVDDALTVDNVRPLVVELREKPVFALVTRQPATLRPSASHLLECALVPDKGTNDESSARLVRIDPDTMDQQSLAPADLILLSHCGKLSDESVQLLTALLRRGRPMVYVAAETIDATNLQRIAKAAGSGLQMPVQFLPLGRGQYRKDQFLANVDRDHPPFRVFGDTLPAVIGRLRFSGGLSSQRIQAEQTFAEDAVLATYGDGTVCLVLSESDAGSLAVLNADLLASNLWQTSAFVPLMDELVQTMLSHGHGRDTFLCGEPLLARLPIDAGVAAELNVVSADSSDTSATPGELADDAAGTIWNWLAPDRPGVYRIQRDDDTVFAATVVVPSAESDLSSLDADVVQNRLAAGREVYFRSAGDQSEGRQDAWKWFAVACVLCFVAEIGFLLAFRT